MKSIELIIPFIIWIASWGYFGFKVKDSNYSLVDILVLDAKKFSLYSFVSILFPIFFVSKLYADIAFVDVWALNKGINLFVGACLFFGLKTFPEILCWILISTRKKYTNENRNTSGF